MWRLYKTNTSESSVINQMKPSSRRKSARTPLALPSGFRYFRARCGYARTPAREIFQMPQPVCPKCSSEYVKRASRDGFERLMSLFYIYPFRCKPCAHRFRLLQRGVTYTRVELDRTSDQSGSEKPRDERGGAAHSVIE
jgi:predicted nucleic acid-binding Zn ribbon protein